LFKSRLRLGFYGRRNKLPQFSIIMSGSDLSDAPSGKIPSDTTLESSLRREVVINFKSGELTVNMIRKLSEQDLGLDGGFYINHPYWKAESKRIIKDESVHGPAYAFDSVSHFHRTNNTLQRALPQSPRRLGLPQPSGR